MAVPAEEDGREDEARTSWRTEQRAEEEIVRVLRLERRISSVERAGDMHDVGW
jgi:hypothetical protein